MIDKIGTASVFVSDQQRAKKFYTEMLGMELRREAPLFPGSTSMWLEVAPKGAATTLVLYAVDENWEHYRGVVGKSQAITLDVSNFDELVADLRAKGVEFATEPQVHPWGANAFIRDSEGNEILLVEQPKMR
jgi:catechol 2,3-dioxygenase-like lactoylglutathione lyase family enzyme